MVPEIRVHTPRGVWPQVTVGQRPVVDYQPSWLLLAVPAVLVLAARKRKSRAQARGAEPSSAGVAGLAGAGGGPRGSARTARAIMTGGVECVREDETVLDAARKMNQLGIGAPPICGNDDRLKGMLTDRDIVVKVLAQGRTRDRPPRQS